MILEENLMMGPFNYCFKSQFTLTGNHISICNRFISFLIEQTNCTGIAYFWEQDKTVNSHFMRIIKVVMVFFTRF
jgi:hypothetical protein